MSVDNNVTLKDVALKAGVSIATVSRVLNESRTVNPEIAAGVLRAKEELGYYQNSIARSLKTHSTQTIGFVTTDISNPYIITVAREIEDLLHEHHYNLFVCSTESNKERELSYLRHLYGRNIDGLVLNSTGLNEDFVLGMNKNMPVVLIHRRLKSTAFHGDLVDSDNIGGAYQLTKHLIALNHKKIYVIKGAGNLSNSNERFAGFQKAMLEIGIVVDERYPFQYDGDYSVQSGYAAVEHLCRLPDKPTAMLSLNNMMTIGALKGFRAKNINAPEDISIASYNNIENIELMAVRPTVLDFDPKQFGVSAGTCLLNRLRDNSIQNQEIIISAKMIHGNAVSAPSDTLNKREFW